MPSFKLFSNVQFFFRFLSSVHFLGAPKAIVEKGKHHFEYPINYERIRKVWHLPVAVTLCSFLCIYVFFFVLVKTDNIPEPFIFLTCKIKKTISIEFFYALSMVPLEYSTRPRSCTNRHFRVSQIETVNGPSFWILEYFLTHEKNCRKKFCSNCQKTEICQ